MTEEDLWDIAYLDDNLNVEVPSQTFDDDIRNRSRALSSYRNSSSLHAFLPTVSSQRYLPTEWMKFYREYEHCMSRIFRSFSSRPESSRFLRDRSILLSLVCLLHAKDINSYGNGYIAWKNLEPSLVADILKPSSLTEPTWAIEVVKSREVVKNTRNVYRLSISNQKRIDTAIDSSYVLKADLDLNSHRGQWFLESVKKLCVFRPQTLIFHDIPEHIAESGNQFAWGCQVGFFWGALLRKVALIY